MTMLARPESWWQAGARDFLSRYEDAKDRLPGNGGLRAAAASALARTGLPGPREEAWHFTSLRPLAEIRFEEPTVGMPAPLSLLPALDAPRLVFVNGVFQAGLSVLPPAITVRTGAPAFGTLARDDEKLVSVNTILALDGAAIEVGDDIDAGALLLVSLGSAETPVSFHPRHSVHLGRGAQLTLIEIAAGQGPYLHNPVLSASVAEGAVLTHLRLQAEAAEAFSMSTVYADVAARGSYDSFSLVLGGRLARGEIHARLGGEQAAAHLNAAQLLSGRQHGDFTTVVTHDAPATASRQTVKTVLTGHARGVFQGKIAVNRIAQKTDGYQMNQALLLSPDAEIDSKPQLEIYADDVKCSHGATIGALDDEQFFYLRSRGIPAAEARGLLVRAFLAEALDPIAHEGARGLMEGAVAQWWERQS